MFPLICLSLCAHKISFVQHFTGFVCIWNDMYEICAKSFLEGTFYVHSKFSCVRSSHDLCMSAHAYSLEGTMVVVGELATSELKIC